MLKASDNALLTQTDAGTTIGQLFRSFWIPALLSEELPAADCDPVRVELLGEPLVAFRDSQGRIGILDEACPHRTASLFFGRNEESGLRCTYHGWKFDVAGTCLDMPNEPPKSDFKRKIRAGAYPVEERGGVIWVYLGARHGEPVEAKLPDLEWSLLPASRCYVTKVLVDCNYLQAMEGDLDSSHSAFLHSRPDSTIDRGGAGKVRKESLRKYSFADKAPRFFTVQTDVGAMLGARRNGDEDSYYWRITQWMLPSYSLMPREDGSLRQCNMRIPINDHQHWFFRAQYHPDRDLTREELHEFRHGGNIFQERITGTYLPKQTLANDFLVDRALQRSGTYSGIKGIPAQDQSVTISMGPVADRTREHLGSADAGLIAARRRLLDAAHQLERGDLPVAPSSPDLYKVRAPALLLPKDVPFDSGAQEQIWAARDHVR